MTRLTIIAIHTSRTEVNYRKTLNGSKKVNLERIEAS